MYVFDVHHIIYGTTLDQMMRTRITPVHTVAVSTGSRQTDRFIGVIYVKVGNRQS